MYVDHTKHNEDASFKKKILIEVYLFVYFTSLGITNIAQCRRIRNETEKTKTGLSWQKVFFGYIAEGTEEIL
jgi:hypothetical protein